MLLFFRYPPLPEPRKILALVCSFLIGLMCLPVWSETNSKITGIKVDSQRNMVVISIKGGPVQIKHHLMSKPSRLVLDCASTAVGKIPGRIKFSVLGLNEIRVAGDKSISRVVMDFGNEEVPAYTIKSEKDQALVVFDISVAIKDSDKKSPSTPKHTKESPVTEKAGDNLKTLISTEKSSLSDWVSAGVDPRIPISSSTTGPKVGDIEDNKINKNPWAEPAAASSNNPDNPTDTDEPLIKTNQVVAQSAESSQNVDGYKPPFSQPMRQVEQAGKPNTSRNQSQPVPNSQRQPRNQGVLHDVGPPLTPPEPDPRLLQQEVTELKFIQVGHSTRLWISAGDHLDYRLTRVSQTKLRLDLINAEIPKFYQKPLKTDLFSTSVEMIIPGSQTIFIQLKEPAPYKVEKKKGVLMVDFSPPRFELTPEMKAAGKSGPLMSSDIKPQTRAGTSTSSSQAVSGQAQEDSEDCEASITCIKKRVEDTATERSKKRRFGEPPSSEILNKTITMDFQDIRLKNAFRLLSEQAAVNITLDPDVDGKTTLRLQNVPLKDVIDTILVTNDLASVMVGDVMRIGKTKKIVEFRGEIKSQIDILDQRILADKNKIKMLEERKRKQENPGLTGDITGSQEVGEVGCFKVNEEEICLFREMVRLTYTDPVEVVKVLDCMFNEKCPKGGSGGQTGQGQQDDRQKMLEQVKSKMADQGFTPDSPGGQSRLQAATTQILDTQRTDSQTSAAEGQKTGVSTSVGPPTTTKDPRTQAIISNSSLTFESKFRRIFITDTLDRIFQMKKVIFSLDVPEPQVMIESRVVQTTRRWGRTLGVMWGGRNNQYGTIENDKRAFWGITGNQGSVPPGGVGLANTATGSGIANTNQPIGTTSLPSGATPPPLNIPSTYAVNLPARLFGLNPALHDLMGLGMQFGLLGAKYVTELDMRIQLGEGSGEAKTIARPRIQILDRQEASILRGTQIPYQSSSANQGTQTQFVDAVLELKVKPTIYNVGRIGMELSVKDNFPEWGRARADGSQPPIAKREAKTNLTVKDGETAVIGGIIRDDSLQDREGWPGLMNIPLIGYLFSNKRKEKNLDELIIFITPTIVKRPSNAS